ncbi:MAG: SRPBCC family protein [Candidatus Thalassarchaeaceae archaeon]
MGEPCFELPEDSPDFGRKIAAYYWWLYPGLMLNIYPWGLSVNIVVPEEVGKTRVIYRGYVADPEMLGKGAGGDLDKVELEDQKIVEGCMRGVSSSAYDRGRYSPTMETGVHHFHRMLTDSR